MNVGRLIALLSQQDPEAEVFAYVGIAEEGGQVQGILTRSETQECYFQSDRPDSLDEALEDGRPVVMIYADR